MEQVKRNKIGYFEAALFFYILSIEIFSYRAGFVFITYGLFALALLLSLPKSHGKLTASILFKYMFILLLAFGLSAVTSTYFSVSVRRWLTMFLMFLTCLAIEIGFRYSSADDFFEFFSNAIIYSCVLAFFYDFITIGPSTYLRYIVQGSRLTAVASQTNVMGVYGAIALNIMFFEAFFNKRKKVLPLMVFPLLMILASQSKKAILCVLVGILIMLALHYRKKKFSGVIVLLIAFFLFMYLTRLPIFESILYRFTSAFETASTGSTKITDWSTYNRMIMIQKGIELFKERPLIGHGIDTYQFISGFGVYSHNNYIELLANNGLIGTIAYYWVYLYAAVVLGRLVFRRNDEKSILLLVIIIATLLLDYGEVSYYNKMTYVYIAWVLVYFVKRNNELFVTHEKESKVRG